MVGRNVGAIVKPDDLAVDQVIRLLPKECRLLLEQGHGRRDICDICRRDTRRPKVFHFSPR